MDCTSIPKQGGKANKLTYLLENYSSNLPGDIGLIKKVLSNKTVLRKIFRKLYVL